MPLASWVRSLATASSGTLRAARVRPCPIGAARCAVPYPKSLSTNAKTKTDAYPDHKHAVQKAKEGDTSNIQESSVTQGLDSARERGTGGHATERRDSAGGATKAKKEFPEAPDTTGMQDERGGRGG